MANARQNDFTLLDFTTEINLYPKVWSLVGSLNLFDQHPITTTVAQVEFVQEKLADIASRKRGGDRNFVESEDARTENLNVPFFPLDRNLKPSDVQGFREYGTGNTSKTVMSEIDRVMRRVRSSQTALKEKGMAKAIQCAGLEGAGIGTDYDYAVKFGQTRPLAPVDFTDLTVDPFDTLEAGVRVPIIKNAQDGTDSFAGYEIVGICGREYFNAAISHPLVEEAYKYYESRQEPLRRRLGMGSENSSVRVFEHKGIILIEDHSGNFPVGEAHFFPKGMPQMFREYLAPADDFEYVNTAGQELYLFYKEDAFSRARKVESECSFLCVNTRVDLSPKSVGTF
ncbi:major capsid protein E [Vibrio phage 1.063.O._10N.261.45.C7]|nr:major capsid protein E [Vibrio phage 1.063.O._10N.261.45.C7]